MKLLKNENKLLNSVFKNFLLGTAISIVCTILGIIINGILIGNFFGKIGLAAFGLTMPIIYGTLAIGYIFSYGGSIVASNNIDNKERVNNNFSVVCIISAIVGISLTIILLLTSTTIAQILGASPESLDATVSFMKGIFLTILPLMFLYIFNNYSRIDGYPLLGLYSGLILFISNLILGLAFVIIFKMGIFGIGLSTALSNVIAVIFLLTHFLSKKSSYKFSKNLKFKKEIKEVINSGLPSALNQVYNMIRTIITNYLGQMVGGLIFLSALSVQSNVYSLLCGISIGIGTTTLALGGVFYGEKDKTQLEQLLKISIKYAIILTSILTIILLIFAPQFVYLFGNNPEVYSTAIRGLRIFAFSLPLSALCYLFLNFYNAIQELKIANYISFAHSFLLLSAFATIFAFLIGGDGIWISFVLCELVTLITLPFIIKIKTKKFPKSIKDLILIENNQSNDEDIFTAYIESEEELLNIVKNIDKKLINNDLSEKNKLKIQLILEEMGLNILTHGYKNNKNKYLNIKIHYKNKDNIIIYFQDNGIPFDLDEYYNDKDEISGIKIIKKFSTNIHYTHNIKLNNNKIIISK